VANATESDPFAGLPDAERLRRVPLLAGARAAEPLSGGITNRNYKVTLASGPVVVRVYEHESSALAINRVPARREHAHRRLDRGSHFQ
jgi:Ser/Thr protein kinase RdoA (MazF antagonist)